MDRERAIGLARKLMALSENNNSLEEAKTAAIKAQAILAKFSISNAELTLQETRVAHSVVTEWGRIALWRKALASVIAPNYRCFWYLQTRDGESIIMFVGLEDEVRLAKEVFKTLESQILDAWNAQEQERRKNRLQGLVAGKYNMLASHSNGTKNDFIFGFLEGLRESFKGSIRDNQYYIVMSLSPIVRKEFDRLRLDHTESRGVQSAGDIDAREKGKEIGENAL